MREGDLQILERAQAVENEHQFEEHWLGWDWAEVKARPQTINRLILDGLVERSYKSHSSTNYKLTEDGRDAALLRLIVNPRAEELTVSSQGLFDTIVGYDDVKEALSLIALDGRQVNVLLEGPPATAKSLFLMELSRLPGVYMATGSRMTAAGLTEALEEQQPALLLLDECEKAPMHALSVLLSVMESGVVTVTKHGAHQMFQVNTSVVGACNSTRGMPPEFISRFGFHLKLAAYDYDDFLQVCERFLSTREGVPADLAREIGDTVWNNLERDVRVARSLARMLREPTKQEVAKWTGFLLKYKPGV